MKEIVLATRNKHKVIEMKHLLESLPVAIRSVEDFPGVPEVEEDGETLEENAIKKARSVALHLKKWALADDTGLEVDALGGAPGVRSARYAGEEASCAANNAKLLAALSGVPSRGRTARFACVTALASPDGGTFVSRGVLEGRIAEAPRGGGGFGYDPLFEPLGSALTLAAAAATPAAATK